MRGVGLHELAVMSDGVTESCIRFKVSGWNLDVGVRTGGPSLSSPT